MYWQSCHWHEPIESSRFTCSATWALGEGFYRLSIYGGHIQHNCAYSLTIVVTKQTFHSRTSHTSPLRPRGVFRELFKDKWPRYIESVRLLLAMKTQFNIAQKYYIFGTAFSFFKLGLWNGRVAKCARHQVLMLYWWVENVTEPNSQRLGDAHMRQ